MHNLAILIDSQQFALVAIKDLKFEIHISPKRLDDNINCVDAFYMH